MIGQGFGFAGLYRSEAECNLDERMVGPNKLGSDRSALGGSNFFSTVHNRLHDQEPQPGGFGRKTNRSINVI